MGDRRDKYCFNYFNWCFMKKYLAYYESEWPANIAELTAVENKPFVGYLKGAEVQYTFIPKPVVSGPWVTFTAEEDNSSIGLEKLSTNQTLEYSQDGSNWSNMNTSTNISLNNGDKVYVRGVLRADNTSSNYTQFKMSGKIAATGNCNALWNYEDLNASLKKSCGYGMFGYCTSLTTAPELPATTLAESCYQAMFVECGIHAAPELPAPTLTTGCYTMMFNGCKNIAYIKCLAEDVTVNSHSFWWTKGVPAAGIFIKSPKCSNWTTGDGGIPSGWTVEDAVL